MNTGKPLENKLPPIISMRVINQSFLGSRDKFARFHEIQKLECKRTLDELYIESFWSNNDIQRSIFYIHTLHCLDSLGNKQVLHDLIIDNKSIEPRDFPHKNSTIFYKEIIENQPVYKERNYKLRIIKINANDLRNIAGTAEEWIKTAKEYDTARRIALGFKTKQDTFQYQNPLKALEALMDKQ